MKVHRAVIRIKEEELLNPILSDTNLDITETKEGYTISYMERNIPHRNKWLIHLAVKETSDEW